MGNTLRMPSGVQMHTWYVPYVERECLLMHVPSVEREGLLMHVSYVEREGLLMHVLYLYIYIQILSIWLLDT